MIADTRGPKAFRLLAAFAVLAGVGMALSGPGASASPQPLTCLLWNGQEQVQGAPGQPTGAPLILTASATNSNQTVAVNNAISKWTQLAAARGPAYQFWTKATRRSTLCSSSKPAFEWIYNCRAEAQPCK